MKASKKVVVVGGVAGGMSAATRARRMDESASIIVLERGGFVSFANCGLPYYLGGEITDRNKLLITNPKVLADRFRIDARVKHEVTRIDRGARRVEVKDLDAQTVYTLDYDKLILAPGATPIIPSIPHVDAPNVFLLRSMEDTISAYEWLASRHPRRAVIIGAGFIGLEMAEALRGRGLEVTIIEKAPHVLPPLEADLACWVRRELLAHDVRVIEANGLKSFDAADGKVTAVIAEDGTHIETDMVMLSIGVRPNVILARDAGLEIGDSGAIRVDSFQRSSDGDIYAVGDAAEVLHGCTGRPTRIPLAGPANRQGRAAGEHAVTGSVPPPGKTLGTAIVKVFDLTVGMTGLNLADARAAGIDVDFAFVHPANHVGYYPGGQMMHLKLIYERPTGRILGAQAVGGNGIDKRIDVVATAIHFRGSIDDLAGLDLAYAPQFGAAKDPVHMAAFVAQNQLRELTPAVAPDEIGQRRVIDVRTHEEFASGSLPAAVNIPVDELRDRLDELSPDEPLATLCRVGQRGYIAQRILAQHGFTDVANIKGGWLLASAPRTD